MSSLNTPEPTDTEGLATLKAQAARFAKDFGITYDNIKLSRHREYVSFKTDTSGSGGWVEGTPAVQVLTRIITRYAILTDAKVTGMASPGAEAKVSLSNPADELEAICTELWEAINHSPTARNLERRIKSHIRRVTLEAYNQGWADCQDKNGGDISEPEVRKDELIRAGKHNAFRDPDYAINRLHQLTYLKKLQEMEGEQHE